QVAENVGSFSVSDTGLLVYRTGRTMTQMSWLDRNGKLISNVGEPGNWDSPQISPDGKRIAVGRTDQGNMDVWILDLARNVPSRFTFDKSNDGWPVWSPDGSFIVFSSSRNGSSQLFQKRSAGAEAETLLLKAPEASMYASTFSPDGKLLLYDRIAGKMDTY